MILLVLILLFVFLVVGIVDAHFSTIIVLGAGYLLSLILIFCFKSQYRKNAFLVANIVYPLYIISAAIFSQSFEDGRYFWVYDPANYLLRFSNISSWDFDYVLEQLENCYFNFADSNALYNFGMDYLCYIMNTMLDGTSVLSITLVQTIFGVLICLLVYDILSLYFDQKKVIKYTLLFALFTLIHVYSCFVIRDIILVFFYTLAFKILLMKRQNFLQLLILLISMIISIGIRLYTGLFFGVFIMLWFYKYLSKSRFRALLYPLVFIGILFIVSLFASSILLEQTLGEMEHYENFSMGSAGYTKIFRNLPPGISHIALSLVKQLPLLGPFKYFFVCESFSNYYIIIIVMICMFFWFLVFYGLVYLLVFKRGYKKLDFFHLLLLGVSFLFIALNTAHLDTRRMLGVFPYIYLCFLLVREYSGKRSLKRFNFILTAMYMAVAILTSI